MDKWDKRFLRLAREVASWSKDPSTQTGAVLVSPDRTGIHLGYNGFARRMRDDADLYADRAEKYERILHAEINAAIHAHCKLVGYTLYTWPFISCHRCAVHMVQWGVARNVAPEPDANKLKRWGPQFKKSRDYYAEAGVEVIEYDLSIHNIDDMELAKHGE